MVSRSAFYDKSLVTDAMVERYNALALAPGHRDALLELTTARSDRDFASAERLSQITVPTLILHGEEDEIIPVADSRKFAEAIPGSRN